METAARRPEPGPHAAVPPSAGLAAAYDAAMRFPLAEAETLRLPPERLAILAAEEAGFARVGVDEAGLTAAARTRLIDPARQCLARWVQARAGFDRAIEPHLPDIRAARSLLAQLDTLQTQRDQRVAHAEQILGDSTRYQGIALDHERHARLYESKRQEHHDVNATIGAYHPLYWVAMLAIGAVEWMINYDVFYLFMGVPAIAAGATIVMGVLLAFAAHAHGKLFKQWRNLFGPDQTPAARNGEWRLLALATLALVVVLAAAGGSRYAAVLRTAGGMVAGNLAGADAAIDVNPMRDVLLSLLANLAAWLVGVFVSYMGHDADPIYMQAAHQHAVSRHRRDRARRRTEAEKTTLQRQYQKRAAELQAKSETRFAAVRDQADRLAQIEKHEQTILRGVAAMLTSTVQHYNAALAAAVIARAGQTRLMRGEVEISPYDFQSHSVVIAPDFVRALMHAP